MDWAGRLELLPASGLSRATPYRQIRLARFRNAAALTHDAESGLLFANERSGPALLSAPAEQGAGNIDQGFVEAGI